MTPQRELIAMRLANMRRMHPQQDNSHRCANCGHQLGLYPSGQAVLRQYPDIRLICEVCFEANPTDLIAAAPGALDEPAESYDVNPVDRA